MKSAFSASTLFTLWVKRENAELADAIHGESGLLRNLFHSNCGIKDQGSLRCGFPVGFFPANGLGRDEVGGFFGWGEGEVDAEGAFSGAGSTGVGALPPVKAGGEEFEGGEGVVGGEGELAGEGAGETAFLVGGFEVEFAADGAVRLDGEGGFFDFGVVPHGWFAPGVVDEVEAGEAVGEPVWEGPAAVFEEGVELGDFFLLEPEVIDGGEVSGGGAVGLWRVEFEWEGAGMNFEDLAALGEGAVEAGVELSEFREVCFLFGWSELGPFFQAFPEEGEAAFDAVVIVVGEELPSWRENVMALAGRAAFAFSRALVGDEAPKHANLVLTAALIPVVSGEGEEVRDDDLADAVVGEDRQPVDHAVVSGAAERVAVHLPEVDGFSGLGGFLASGPEIGLPRDFEPGGFGLGGEDCGDDSLFGGGEGEQGGAKDGEDE